MRMLPIGITEAVELESADADALFTIIKGFALGAGLWTRERRTSSPTGASSTSTLEDVPLYMARTSDVTFAEALVGETVANQEPFTWVSPGNYDLRAGDLVINDADTRLRFRLRSSDYDGTQRTGTARQE